MQLKQLFLVTITVLFLQEKNWAQCDPDQVDPIWQIATQIGNVVADNNVFTIPGTTANFGSTALHLGECVWTDIFTISGFDQCDGVITSPTAVQIQTINTIPNSGQLPTTATIEPDGFGVYQLRIHWSIGITTMTISMQDMAGNSQTLTLIRSLTPGNEPTIVLPGNRNFPIAKCQDNTMAVIGINIHSVCDQIISGNLDLSLDVGGNIRSFIPVNTQNAGASAYFEYNVDLTVADDGGVLHAAYNDAFGSYMVSGEIRVIKENSPDFSAACLPELNVSLNQRCNALVTFKQILNGCIDCLDKDSVIISIEDSNPFNDTQIDGSGRHLYHVSIPSEDFYCSGVINAIGSGPYSFCNDLDVDGVPDYEDNCPSIANPDQKDQNNNGIGDVCEHISGSDMHSIASAAGDIFVENPARGIIFKVSNGNCYRLSTDINGNVSSVKVDCPN